MSNARSSKPSSNYDLGASSRAAAGRLFDTLVHAEPQPDSLPAGTLRLAGGGTFALGPSEASGFWGKTGHYSDH